MASYNQDAFTDQFDITKKLGSGNFAIVRLCRDKKSGKEFAAKCISKSSCSQEEIDRETMVLEKVGNHQNIVNFYGAWEQKRETILLLEYINGGELFEYLSEKDALSEEEASFFIKQVMQGLKFCHQQKGRFTNYIVHLDIKPENMLLQKTKTRKPLLKLVDFGLAQWVTPGQELRLMQGTPEFVAPEVLNFDPIGFEADIWSVGVTTYILLTGYSPFLGDNDTETYSNITSVRSTIRGKPGDRLALLEALQHGWIAPKNNTEKLARKKSFIRSTKVLKAFVAKKRWRQVILAVQTGQKMAKFAKENRESLESSKEEKTSIRSPTKASEDGRSKFPLLKGSDDGEIKPMNHDLSNNEIKKKTDQSSSSPKSTVHEAEPPSKQKDKYTKEARKTFMARITDKLKSRPKEVTQTSSSPGPSVKKTESRKTKGWFRGKKGSRREEGGGKQGAVAEMTAKWETKETEDSGNLIKTKGKKTMFSWRR